jgi:ABC-type bacteriocin/lantibiotic exporter with double-glycine peptidase domain
MKNKVPFVLQQDQSDCGAACLLSVIKFHKGYQTLENIRKLSGTSVTGTTLLGLYQCAQQTGFDVKGVKTGVDQLKDIEGPCILHVVIDNALEHYVVYYGRKDDPAGPKFTIGDPGRGMIELTEPELEEIWKTKAALILSHNQYFIKESAWKKNKWQLFKAVINDDLPILGITIVLGVVAAVLGLSVAIFSQKLVDHIIPSGNTVQLITSLTLLSLVLIARAGINYMRQHFLLLQSRDFNQRVAGGFFTALLRLSKSFFDQRKTGDMTARLNDVLRIQRNIAYIAGSVFNDVLISVVALLFIVAYSWQIAIITSAFIPVIILITMYYLKPIKSKQMEVMAAYAYNESNYIDSIKGIDTIKTNNLEGFFAGLNKKIFAVFQQKSFDLGQIGNKFNMASEIAGIILTITVISCASLLVFKHQIKIGEMLALISMVSGLMPAVSRLSQINLQIQEAQIAFDRMYEFTAIEPEYQTDTTSGRLAVERVSISNLSFRFPGRAPILKDVSLFVDKTELIAILGESGSGKSTLGQMLQKFYAPEAGEISINGTDLSAINTGQWRREIASVPQDINMFSGSLLRNIALDDTPAALSRAYQLCEDLGFGQFFGQFQQGYDTIVGEEGINLSGGQKQLVALARALYKQPQLLLLDEATSAMDRKMEAFVLGLISRLKHNMAVIFITHRLQTIKFADRIYIIENGTIQDFGNHPDLMIRDNFYSRSLNDLLV